MSLFDDIKASAQTAVGQLGSNVQDYLKTNITQAFVKVGEAPKGNLTPAQIAAGQTGATPPIATPASQMMSAAQSALPYVGIALGALALFMFLKKRR